VGSYKFQKVSAPWTNNSDKFAVVVGSEFNVTFGNNTGIFFVQDAQSNVVDSVRQATTTVTAVGEEFEMQYLPRKMLVPPGFQFGNSGSLLAMVFICDFDKNAGDSMDSAEAAIKIL
jgi:hypothetical protein